MTAIELLFHGHAFPSVAVSSDPSGIIRKASDGRDMGRAALATIMAKGSGRSWTATQPRAFWRTFAEIDRASTNDIAQIFQRYGDPDNLIEEGGASHTGFWINHQALLGTAARAWDPVDENGISHRTNEKARLAEPRWFLGEFALKDVQLVQNRSTGGLVPQAKTLIAYMLASASMMIEAATPMKRCYWCSHWFGIQDIRARFCSVSCRNSSHRFHKKDI